jgi:hypothetical protein
VPHLRHHVGGGRTRSSASRFWHKMCASAEFAASTDNIAAAEKPSREPVAQTPVRDRGLSSGEARTIR